MAEFDLTKQMEEATKEWSNIAKTLLAIQQSLDKLAPTVSKMEPLLASLEPAVNDLSAWRPGVDAAVGQLRNDLSDTHKQLEKIAFARFGTSKASDPSSSTTVDAPPPASTVLDIDQVRVNIDVLGFTIPVPVTCSMQVPNQNTGDEGPGVMSLLLGSAPTTLISPPEDSPSPPSPTWTMAWSAVTCAALYAASDSLLNSHYRCSIDCLDYNTSEDIASVIEHKRQVIRPLPWPSFFNDQAWTSDSSSSTGDRNILFGWFLRDDFPKVFHTAISSIEWRLRGKLSCHPSSIAENDRCNQDTMWYMDNIFPRLKRWCLDNQCMEQAYAIFDVIPCPERHRTGISMQALAIASVLKIFRRGATPSALMADFLEIGIQLKYICQAACLSEKITEEAEISTEAFNINQVNIPSSSNNKDMTHVHAAHYGASQFVTRNLSAHRSLGQSWVFNYQRRFQEVLTMADHCLSNTNYNIKDASIRYYTPAYQFLHKLFMLVTEYSLPESWEKPWTPPEGILLNQSTGEPHEYFSLWTICYGRQARRASLEYYAQVTVKKISHNWSLLLHVNQQPPLALFRTGESSLISLISPPLEPLVAFELTTLPPTTCSAKCSGSIIGAPSPAFLITHAIPPWLLPAPASMLGPELKVLRPRPWPWLNWKCLLRSACPREPCLLLLGGEQVVKWCGVDLIHWPYFVMHCGQLCSFWPHVLQLGDNESLLSEVERSTTNMVFRPKDTTQLQGWPPPSSIHRCVPAREKNPWLQFWLELLLFGDIDYSLEALFPTAPHEDKQIIDTFGLLSSEEDFPTLNILFLPRQTTELKPWLPPYLTNVALQFPSSRPTRVVTVVTGISCHIPAVIGIDGSEHFPCAIAWLLCDFIFCSSMAADQFCNDANVQEKGDCYAECNSTLLDVMPTDLMQWENCLLLSHAHFLKVRTSLALEMVNRIDKLGFAFVQWEIAWLLAWGNSVLLHKDCPAAYAFAGDLRVVLLGMAVQLQSAAPLFQLSGKLVYSYCGSDPMESIQSVVHFHFCSSAYLEALHNPVLGTTHMLIAVLAWPSSSIKSACATSTTSTSSKFVPTTTTSTAQESSTLIKATSTMATTMKATIITLAVPWDPGRNSSASAWGQAEFQGGRNVMGTTSPSAPGEAQGLPTRPKWRMT